MSENLTPNLSLDPTVFQAGQTVSPEALSTLASNIGGELRAISWQAADLTPQQATLVDNVIDFGSRTIAYAAENKLVSFDTESDSFALAAFKARDVWRRTDENFNSETPVPATSSELVTAMHHLTGGVVSVRTREAELRAPAEDYAMAVLPLLSEAAAAKGGLQVDAYIAGNIAQLVNQYQATVAESAAK